MITIEHERSRHGPTFKLTFGGSVNGVPITGNVREVHIGLDELTSTLVRTQTSVFRAGRVNVTHAARLAVYESVLVYLQDLETKESN